MMTTPLTYAAELEQAATISAFEDQCPGEPQAPTAARYGYQGIELMWEYENAIYEIEREGRPAAFVLFH
jgi:hypothetical protein